MLFNFNFYSLPPLISSVMFFVLGGYVFLKNRKSAASVFFGLVCLATFWWQFSWFFLFNVQDDQSAFWLVKIGYAGIILIPVLFFHFFTVFLKSGGRIDKFLLVFSYAAALFFEAALFLSDFFISGFYHFSWGFYPKAAILHPFYLLLLSALTIRIVYLLAKALKENDNRALDYFQKKYLLAGFVFYFFAASDFLINYGIDFYPFGFVFIIFFLAITAYTISRYHLFSEDIFFTEILIGITGIILFILPFAMPSAILKIVVSFAFFLFSFLSYYLVILMKIESGRREDAERVAARERELRRSAEIMAEDLKRLDRAKTQFLLSTQHHLRSPLSVVQGYLSMIAEGSYGEISSEIKSKIAASLESTKKLVHLVDNLLDLAHLQMGDKNLGGKELVDMGKLAAEIVAEFEKSAQSKKIYLRIKIPDIPLPPVFADRKGVYEAIYNIIDNAVKYTGQGGIEVSLAVAGEKLRLVVADTGIGIGEKDRQGLFNRIFERGDKAKNLNFEGKGIGLYLAAQMIAGNGGTINVESDGWNKGSKFIVEFPFAAKDGG